ncbi:MAG: alpha/beta hydrolase, partial [Bacteroidota bacterium]
VDERAFVNIILPSVYTIHHIKWVKPSDKESLEDYSKQLLLQIDQSPPFALVGLSFGGIIATEISNLISVEKTILISSVSSSQQIPWYFSLAGKLRLNKLIPVNLLHKNKMLFNWMFGVKSKKEQLLLKEINDTPDLHFTKWAVDCIIHWKRKSNRFIPIHIHGTKDKIFPIKNINVDFPVENGGHFMIFSEGKYISEKIAAILSSVTM